MPMFVGSQSFTSQPSFMFVSAPISELRESNQNNKEKEKEKNFEIGSFQFNTFPGHIIYPFFNQRYLFSTCIYAFKSPVHHKLKAIIKDFLIMLAKPGHPYVHSTTVLDGTTG